MFGRSLTSGHTSQEVEPGGRAAHEIAQSWTAVCTLGTASTTAQHAQEAGE